MSGTERLSMGCVVKEEFCTICNGEPCEKPDDHISVLIDLEPFIVKNNNVPGCQLCAAGKMHIHSFFDHERLTASEITK